ncbi:MAG TPA: hypothetical protein VFQ60_00485 [Patescibacteria group bacterium]|nr:hypothetical protein [Patescibacteria group bacterium]
MDENLLVQLKADAKQGLALDIDGTLSATNEYWITRVMETHGNPENLSVQEIIQKYRYCSLVPYWQNESAQAWMEEQRTSNETQEKLDCIPGAKEFVQKIHEQIPIKLYLTVRPECVHEGTSRWLKKNGFPDAPIMTRPLHIPHEQGSSWKAKMLHDLFPHVIGIVDDDSSVYEGLPTYKGTIFLLGQTQSPRNDISMIPCPTWADVFNKIVCR